MTRIKAFGISLMGLLALFAISSISLLDSHGNVAEAQTGTTGTSIDNSLNNIAPTSTAPTAESCKKFVDDEMDRQWQSAGFEVLRSLNKLQTFTAADRDTLKEREKMRTNRQKYFLRLAVLTQLAEH
jgi:hypothetical protein